eukprot:CAMPEP_0172498898 /NCGR_PEP_ID=MMETSP1066-20121228/119218_1 /TAXON_ID=671091 /ORGANISM="Coscinodiscus wailesii, Strain CCMP2513" /LENGTH=875 /DNA_ID=CAMNT_0013272367 /DNA_START=56 /DNA_END=2686 /DNA_ORIENTATION=+
MRRHSGINSRQVVTDKITTPTHNSNTTTNNNTNIKIGPRAKCDQVVYEAIAKAAEIIVRSRCHIPPVVASAENNGGDDRKSNGKSSSSSRFNIEVAEVEQVRSILQRWRRSLHVPLRLDVFYQRDPGRNNNPNNIEYGDSTLHQNHELLERWCIDYVASSPNESSSGIFGHADPAADTLAQLRQVCKKVVILLRTLHCLARMLPTYKLHRSFSPSQRSHDGFQAQAMAGCYYSQQRNGYMTGAGGIPDSVVNGGSIGFSFYASGTRNDVSSGTGPGLQQQGVDDTSSFTRHNFSPVPTPYGMLFICVQYAPNPSPRITQSRPIAIMGTNRATALVDDNARHALEQQANGQDDYYVGETDAMNDDATNGHRPQSYTDYIIQDYAENHVKAGHEEKEKSHQSTNKSGVATNPMYVDENKAMSGLSLALMNDCVVTKTPVNGNDTKATTGSQHKNNRARPAIKRMGSMDDRILRRDDGTNTGSLPNEGRGRTLMAEHASADRRRDLHSNALSASPKHYLMNHMRTKEERRSMRDIDSNVTSGHSGEYGYAYNNIHLNKKTSSPTPTTIQQPTRSFDPQRVSSPHPPGSTPPFSQSPRLTAAMDPNTSPKASGRSSPPFRHHPMSLHQNPETHSRIMAFGQQQKQWSAHGGSPDVQGLLLPPNALEVLQSSPFRLPTENSLLSSLSGPAPLPGSGMVSQPEMPFVGSFGSVSSPAAPSVRHSYYNSATSFSAEKHVDGSDTVYEDMPFANNVDSSYSIHGGEASAASSFAYRCATASRLQLFDSCKNVANERMGDGGDNRSTSFTTNRDVASGDVGGPGRMGGGNVPSNDYDDDFSSQLADFHSFGASLANLQKSTTHRSMVVNNSLSDSASATATPVA